MTEFEPVVADPNPVDLIPQTPSPAIPRFEVAQQRAIKASIGIPDLHPEPDEVESKINQGKEGPMRAQTASYIDWMQDVHRRETISSFMNHPLTDEDKLKLKDLVLTQAVKQDPQSVFEEQYASGFVYNVKRKGEENKDSFWNSLDEKQRDSFILSGRDAMAKDQILNTLQDEAETNLQNQSWPGWIADRAKEWLIPGYWQIKLRGQLPTGFLGSDLEKDHQAGYLLPLPQFKVWASERVQQLMQDNPAMAIEWITAMRGMSMSDQSLHNLLTGVDFLGQPIGAGIAFKGIRKGADALFGRGAISSALRTGFKEPASEAAMHEAAGAVKEAASADAGKQIVDKVKGKNTVRSMLDNLPGIFNGSLDAVKNFPGRLRREAVERIMQSYEVLSGAVRTAAINTVKVDRLPILQAAKHESEIILENLRGDYPGLENTILNNAFRYDDAINGHWVDFYVGPNGDSLFSSEKKVHDFAKSIGLKEVYEPEQQGTGWAMRVSKPLRETEYARDVLLATEETKTPQTWLNSLVGHLITPEETLSRAQRANRLAATYGPSVYQQLAKKTLEPVNKLNSWFSLPYSDKRRKWKEFKKVVETIQREPKLFETPDELDQLFKKSIGRLPDEQEIYAAYAWKQGEELYQTWRTLQDYKNKFRLGAQTHDIEFAAAGTDTAKSYKPQHIKIDGIDLREFPTRDDTVVILTQNPGDWIVKKVSEIRGKFRQQLISDVNNGEWKAIQILNHTQQPLKGLSKNIPEDSYPRYIITDRATSGPLEWKPMDRRPPDHEYDHYVKQAIVKYDPISNRYLYLGDKTISVHNIRAMSSDVAKKLDKIRQLIKDNNLDDARRFHDISGLPQEFSEILGWFKPVIYRGERGKFQKTPAKLSLEDPIMSVPRNNMLVGIDRDLRARYELKAGKNGKPNQDGFKDLANEGTHRYLGEQYDPTDIFTLGNEGTAQNPLYRVKPVEYINPITSLNRALNRISIASFMDDYKAFSVEHWIQEARKFFKPGIRDTDIMSAPYFYFHNADSFYRDVVGDDVARLRNLKTANLQIKHLIGVPDPTSTWLHSAAQKLSDSIYNKGYSRIALATEDLLPRLKDPYVFFRSMTFHAKLGIFNIPQLWVQSQTFATIWGIAGAKFAAPGTKAAFLYQWARINRNPEIMQALDKIASRKLIPGTASWKPGEWIEATEIGDSTGFLNIAGEHAYRDSPFKNNFITGGGQTFLDAGTVFFREGEKSVRLGAWYTAFKEFRDAKPTGAITNADKLKILQRADLLYANMSRASTSNIQHGIFSIPTQFLSYQMRMAELVMGKRLTTMERYRLLGTYAAIYGIPGAFGLSGLPLGDYIRKWSIEDGYNVGENYINTAITDGLPSLILGLATGVHYNVQERFGIQGFDPIREALRGDKTVWDLLTGATGQTVANAIMSTHGFWKAMGDLIAGQGEFKFKPDDLLEPFKEVSSINSTYKFIVAMNYARLISKKENYMGDVTPGHAIFQYLSGLQPQEITDNYIKANIMDKERDYQKYTFNKFIEEYRRGVLAAESGDPTNATDYFERARNWLISSGYPRQEWSSAFAIAAQSNSSMISKGNYDWAYGKHVPEYRRETSEKQGQYQLQQQYGNK